MHDSERWLPVVGYEGLYEVSDLGRVRGLDRWVESRPGRLRLIPGRLILAAPSNQGYLRVKLCRRGRQVKISVHRLVLEAFIGPCPAAQEARHGPGGKLDNRVSNLCWGTKAENMADQRRDGTLAAKLTDAIVRESRRRVAAGETMQVLADEFGVSRVAMSRAVRAIDWRHV